MIKGKSHAKHTTQTRLQHRSFSFTYTNFVEFIVWTMENTAVKVGTMTGYRLGMRYYYKWSVWPYRLSMKAP
ncbi:hypothetical protein DYB32_009831 [Aphanomyces invadans]|uniref:Uncharacterized protein n=1 Tax=Aphanomyces invadans TaxID=157072 RepID=A0A3R6YS02_9STRA|nr:hypothetical protein DYB32_009831 [Aphanomyces invadans]